MEATVGPVAAVADHWDVRGLLSEEHFSEDSTRVALRIRRMRASPPSGRAILFPCGRTPAPMIVRVQAPSLHSASPGGGNVDAAHRANRCECSECHQFVKRRPARRSSRSPWPPEICVARAADDIADKRSEWVAHHTPSPEKASPDRSGAFSPIRAAASPYMNCRQNMIPIHCDL
jgi:hypothetical protein